VAITTSFGAAYLTNFCVESNEIDADGNKIPPAQDFAYSMTSSGLHDVNTPTQTNNSQASPNQTQSAVS
jgi:hypothetical protein